ncbi:MAG: hypothetical protein WAT39_03640 [Planctomycetota bacterium]
MRHASLSLLLTGVALLAGCSSGNSDGTATVRIKCLGGQAFCLISCDLGCSQTGCSVSEIAENQRLHFKFSDRVDPTSVDTASISIRTASGVAPDGEYLVDQAEVTFVPKVRTVGGVSTFGFLRNESYIITLAGGATAAQGVRGLSGDTLTQELTCTVRATLGIQDEDQLPPTVTLVAPTDVQAVPLDPTLVLQFSELIDTTALQSPLSEASPIRVVLRSTLPSGECNRDDDGIALEGLPQLATQSVNNRDVTVVTFQPSVQLPGRACLTIYVSGDLRDLSGRAGVPAQFEMFTVAAAPTQILLTEAFVNSTGQEVLVSGGVWGGASGSGARPGLLGGDGRHGSFKPQLGNSLGSGEFEWNVSSFTIPGTQTTSGQNELVTDGRFFFTDFVLAEGQTIKFIGAVPAEIHVRGKCEILGTIKVNAPDMPFFVPTGGLANGQRVSTFRARSPSASPVLTPVAGQPGGAGVCGGGRGGDGGTKCLSAGPIIVSGVNLTDGQRGQPVFLRAGHAYGASAGATGGNGAAMNPATGLPVNTPLISALYRVQVSPGGAGGAFMLAGTTSNGTLITAQIGPAPPVGTAFPLLPFPANPPAGYQSLDHFTVGGSGGGGGGSHSFGTIFSTGDQFMAGHGGSGGGGAVAFRVGGELVVGPLAQLQSKGGAGVVIDGDDPLTPTVFETTFGISSPGGGGSGGSFLLQSARRVAVTGLIDTSGGPGSRTAFINPPILNVLCNAGAGSSGFYRLEAPDPATNVTFSGPGATVPAFNAADNVGPLGDRDAASGDVSTWRSSGRVFPPTWEGYELDVDVDGDGVIDATYSDKPGGVLPPVGGPVQIEFQGATLNQAGTAPKTGTVPKPWRTRVAASTGGPVVPSISQDSVTGLRFRLTYDRATFPNQVIRALRVFART